MTTGKGNAWITAYLQLLFNATTAANVAQNASSSPIASIYVSLHTAAPGATGTQATSEAAYTSYARVAVVRTSSGWTVSGQTVTPVNPITFPTATGGSETETYFGLGSLASGAGELFYWGPLTPSITVTNGVTPILTTASMAQEQ